MVVVYTINLLFTFLPFVWDSFSFRHSFIQAFWIHRDRTIWIWEQFWGKGKGYFGVLVNIGRSLRTFRAFFLQT